MRTILFSSAVLLAMSCSVLGQTQAVESPSNQTEGKVETPTIQVDGRSIKFQSMEHGKLHFEGGVDRGFHDVEVETQKKIMEYRLGAYMGSG